MIVNDKILIVTIAHIESKAVIEVFQEYTGQPPKAIQAGDLIYYELGVINSIRVFMAQSVMGAGGSGSFRLTVQETINVLSPSAVIITGIAFGTNADKQSIGDILVSQQISSYDIQRIGNNSEEKNSIILRGDRPLAASRLINLFRNATLEWKGSNVHYGLIFSGEKLIDSIDFQEQLRWFEPEAVGGEMEGIGSYIASKIREVEWIIVKSICDWADGQKAREKRSRQSFAAMNAANFVLQGLKAQLSEQEASPQEPLDTTSQPIQWHSVQRALRVFLCHSSDDKQVVRKLYWRLKNDNVDAWLDEENLLPGQDWNYEISKAVRTSDNVIVCLSGEAVTKEGYIQKEIRYALDVADEKSEGTIFLIPLILEKCEVPDRLRKWQWVNYFEDHGYKRLITALRVRASLIGAILPAESY